jgi:hypothetical protein
LEKWIFQFGIGLSPVLQYRPKPTRTAGPSAIFPSARTPGRRSDRAQRDSAPSHRCSDRCQLPSAPTRHTCSLSCAALRADVRTLAPCMHDSCSVARHLKATLSADAADQPPPPLHALHMQPSPMHPTPSPSVRRKSHSLLFPQLPSSSRHSTRAAIAAVPQPPSTAASGPPPATPAPPRAPPESQGPQRPLQRQPRPLLRSTADNSSPPEHAVVESYPR